MVNFQYEKALPNKWDMCFGIVWFQRMSRAMGVSKYKKKYSIVIPLWRYAAVSKLEEARTRGIYYDFKVDIDKKKFTHTVKDSVILTLLSKQPGKITSI